MATALVLYYGPRNNVNSWPQVHVQEVLQRVEGHVYYKVSIFYVSINCLLISRVFLCLKHQL